MSDSTGKPKWSKSIIVAIVFGIAMFLASAVAIWQTSHYATVQSGRAERDQIITKIDGLSEKISQMNVTIAQIGQKLEDHITAGKY